MFPASAPAIRCQGFPDYLVGRDHKYTIRIVVRDIDDTQVPARSRLAQSNPGTLAARPILTGLLQHFNDFILVHLVAINMGRTSRRIYVESGLHAAPIPF
jgi:hypothetical protein